MDKRGIQGGDQWRYQDEDEVITRTLDVTPVNAPSLGAVTLPTMTVATYPGDVDVTAAVTGAGPMIVAGQVITMLELQTLTKGTDYCVAVGYHKDGNTLENRFYVRCPDEEP